ncbi:P protein-like isoform X2 [Littorina saxatilis]|uniref:Citrate transporter-like domain-containing protein n=1 Tax=Littorina saxatilis TaxID=31220 RepID=A0AAN9B1X8_9CAEN
MSSSDHLLSASPTKRAGEPMGLHINPSRSRGPSATSEMMKPRQTPSRLPSSTSFLSSPTSPMSPLTDDDVFAAGESAPLICKNLRDPEDSRSDGGSLSSLSTIIFDTAIKKGGAYWLQTIKIIILFGITVLCCATVVKYPEQEEDLHEVIARVTPQVIYSKSYDNDYPILQLNLIGPLSEKNTSNTNNSLDIEVKISSAKVNDSGWLLRVNRTALQNMPSGQLATFHHEFRCSSQASDCNITVRTGSEEAVPLVYSVHQLSTQLDHEIVYAALILCFVYVLIIFELVHRTLAAMLGALAAIAVLSAINQRPSTETIIGWMEMETLMLLFGMMIIVAVVSDTGIFDFSALKAYQLAEGKVWPLVTLLCIFSAVVSAFLDNVTTILLLAPVTIRLCEVLNLEPRVILIAEVLFSNIGGTATAIGDPPNVIIVGQLESDGITFTVFTAHMVIGIILITFVAYGFLRFYYRNMEQLSNPDPPEIAELNHEIQIWRRAASRLVVVTREETLMRALFLQKAVELENLKNKTIHRKRKADKKDLNATLRQLEREYQIKDMSLLIKCGFVLLTCLVFFFMYSFVSSIHIGLGWIAVLGAMWLLVIADTSDLESILHRVEWSTLLFFGALFILMEALAELHLMEWIGEQMRDLIINVDAEYRLTAAVVIIVWVSALASSFIDNIPYTTAMIPVLKQLSDDVDVDLQLLPLVIALAFGACLGGNGTLIGASANVVCAGIAEQHGYTISFKQFFKVGFPMMLVTTLTATVYLLICHSAIKWNSI